MFRSRWGFYPCDYPTYRKLKFLNQVYWQAVRLAHAWSRWQRKDPKNRVMRRRIRNAKGQTIGYQPPVPRPEPKICSVFSQKVFEPCHVDKKGNACREGLLQEKVITDDRGVAAAYVLARKPVADPAIVPSLPLSLAEIEELYEQARRWLEEQDVK